MIVTLDEVAGAVRASYIGDLGDVTKLPQTKCDTFHVYFGDGSENFVKVTKSTQEERYAAQIAVASMLSTQGVPIPAVVRTKDGNNYVALGENRYLEMHAWVPRGRPYRASPDEIAQVARAMAQVHVGADALDGGHPAVKVLSAKPYTGMPPGRQLPDAALLDHFASRLHEIPEVLRSYVARDLPFMREALVQEIPGKDWGVIHGDLHGEQTLFDVDTSALKAVIDWEWTLWGPRARDLSFSLATLAVGPAPAGATTLPISEPLAAVFLDAYRATRPEFPEEDLRAVSEHLEWDITCRRTRYITELLQGGMSEARVTQLVDWFNDKALNFERLRQFRTLLRA